MAVPVRNSNAPYVAGATAEAADFETDISNLHAEIANIENANVAAAADIDGTKLADNSIAAAKFLSGAFADIQFAKINTSVASKTGVSTFVGGNLRSGTSYSGSIVIPIFLNVDSEDDMILLEFIASDVDIDDTAAGHVWTFAINGTTQGDLYQIDNETGSDEKREVHMIFAKVATGLSGSVLFGVQEKQASGGTSSWSSTVSRVFRATVIPLKS